MRDTTRKLTAGLFAATLALGLGACSDEDGDGARTDEEVGEVDDAVDQGADEVQEEVDQGADEIQQEVDQGQQEAE